VLYETFDNFLVYVRVDKGDTPLSASKKQEIGCKKQDRILKELIKYYPASGLLHPAS
jgi:hypothetical protein